MSIFVLLGVLFIGLKLAAVGTVATWPWWMVTLPIWGGFAFVLGIMFLSLMITLFCGSTTYSFRRG